MEQTKCASICKLGMQVGEHAYLGVRLALLKRGVQNTNIQKYGAQSEMRFLLNY